MRKKELMIAAAVAALVAGTGIAGAQSNPSSSAPAEKFAPSANEKSGGANSMQMKDEKGAQRSQGSRSETTGQAPGSAQSGGTSQSDEKAGQQPKRQSQGAQQPKSQGAQQQQRSNETTGQAPSSGRTGSSGSQQNESGSQQNQSNQPSQNQNQMGSGRSGEPSGQAPARSESNQGRTGTSSSTTTNTDVSVNLNTEQKQRIHEVIVKERSAPRVSKVDFQLSVGTPVPRNKVKLARLPRTIVEIQPAWRDYEYFLVGDQIVIVDPRTLKIVAIIEV